jgi:cytochrome c biogenesis protein CcmG/thiol:disulfide interchange protein DsbE
LERLHQHFSQNPFVLLSVDIAEEASKVRSFAKDKGLSFPILLDRNGAVASQYGVRAHPVAYLVDINGKIVGVAQGFRKWDRKEMKTLVSSLMSSTES